MNHTPSKDTNYWSQCLSIIMWVGLSIVYTLILPFILIGLSFFLITKKINFSNFKGKLGFYPKRNIEGKEHYWIHLSSLGEWNTVKRFVNEFTKITTNKSNSLLITYFNQDMTSVPELNSAHITSFFLPLESPHAFFYLAKHYRIKCLIIAETEIWPILLLSLKALGKKSLLINATLFEKETKSYRRFAWMFSPLFKSFNHIYPSSTSSKNNFIKLGVPLKNITSFNNLKLDIPIQKGKNIFNNKEIKNNPSNLTTILFASIHFEELPLITPTINHLAQKKNRIILVFRELLTSEQIKQVRSITNINFTVVSDTDQPSYVNNIIWNRYGDLRKLYYSSDLVVMGGTFAPIGGHNFLEAIAANCPIMMGPYYFHFTELVAHFQPYLYFVDPLNLTKKIDFFFKKDYQKKTDYGKLKLLEFQGISKKLVNNIIRKI